MSRETKCFNCDFILLHEDAKPKRCPGCDKFVGQSGGLTSDNINRLCLALQYTSYSLKQGLESIGLSDNNYYLDLVEHALITEAACARCVGCGWWFCTSELEPENGTCESCTVQLACY